MSLKDVYMEFKLSGNAGCQSNITLDLNQRIAHPLYKIPRTIFMQAYGLEPKAITFVIRHYTQIKGYP